MSSSHPHICSCHAWQRLAIPLCLRVYIVQVSEAHSTDNGTTSSKHLWKWLVVCIFQQKPFPHDSSPTSPIQLQQWTAAVHACQEKPTLPLSAVHSQGSAVCLPLQLASGKEGSGSKPGSSGRGRLEGEVGAAPTIIRTQFRC